MVKDFRKQKKTGKRDHQDLFLHIQFVKPHKNAYNTNHQQGDIIKPKKKLAETAFDFLNWTSKSGHLFFSRVNK